MKAIPIYVLGLLIAGCAQNQIAPFKDRLPAEQVAKRQMLIGSWKEEYTNKDGRRWQQFTEFYKYGTYRYQFRHFHPDGGFDDDFEYGQWGISGDIFFTIETNRLKRGQWGKTSPYEDIYDAYSILTLTDDEFVYKSVQSGITFTATRASSDQKSGVAVDAACQTKVQIATIAADYIETNAQPAIDDLKYPAIVDDKGDVWLVWYQLPNDATGGGAMVFIDKLSCKVMQVLMGQ